MIIGKTSALKYSDITPKAAYLNRRRFLSGVLAGGSVLAAGFELGSGKAFAQAGRKLPNLAKSPFSTSEKVNSREDITTYNNYYEFGTQKDEPAANARNFKTTPWTVSLEGEVDAPKTLDMDAIMKLAPLEERIYRLRCVEGWSVVVPWVGYSLSALLKQVQPTSKAKYVAFQSYFNTKQMPLWSRAGIKLPYVEGLRMDEAMHPLAMIVVGLYGETLPNQNGAPVRIVVPWKYGFKSIKSIIKVKFVEKEPPTTWNMAISNEYGFYSNVNPKVDHPRWSQAKERRLGEIFRRDTLMFNGYDQVASLYTGMDLRKNY
jgi:methionine sulfoxide reductase catalytic subunit